MGMGRPPRVKGEGLWAEIREKRIAWGLTQQQMADILGCTKATVGAWEKVGGLVDLGVWQRFQDYEHLPAPDETTPAFVLQWDGVRWVPAGVEIRRLNCERCGKTTWASAGAWNKRFCGERCQREQYRLTKQSRHQSDERPDPALP